MSRFYGSVCTMTLRQKNKLSI